MNIKNNVNTFGRGNCKEAIFALGNGISRRKNQHPRPTYTPSARFYCERAAALSRSPWEFGWLRHVFILTKSPLDFPPAHMVE